MADFDTELDLFSFIPAEPVPEPPPPPRPARRKPAHRELQQLCFGFLWSLNPDAAAMRVPARFHKYQVTAAGFWRGETGRNRSVERTAVVVLYERFEHCFADCADRDARLAAIHELRAEKEALEAEIRRTEPELGSTDDLFSDFRVWNYAASRNRDYLKLRRRLEKLQHALHQGSRLEHIRHTGVADYCYLAVPENLVAPDEIAAGWGLVYLEPGRKFRLVREAEEQAIATPEGRQLLAENIAITASCNARFAAGLDVRKDGTVVYRRPPRKRSRLK